MSKLLKHLPDAAARLTALTDHNHTLLVEAGAGSGKTALMAGRVAMMLLEGISPKDIVAITFTEAAASELLERVERFAAELAAGHVPRELEIALPNGLSLAQTAAIATGVATLDEITCSTIHGFCQQLVRPYPVEAGIDPGAEIIDPAAAELAFQDLMEAWLSARFGRDRSTAGLGRIPPLPGAGGDEDFLAELVAISPDEAVRLISATGEFLKDHPTATAPSNTPDPTLLARLIDAIDQFKAWYDGCGVEEESTAELLAEFASLSAIAQELAASEPAGKRLAELLRHDPTSAWKDAGGFREWKRKGKWEGAAKQAGLSKADGEQLSNQARALYEACEEPYIEMRNWIGGSAFQRFVAEFDVLRGLYANYKRDAALLDFDDLLLKTRDLLKTAEPVRRSLAGRYSRILVDEFQDTDPLQAEILWLLAGEGAPNQAWSARVIRPGALFLVGDPKQAIYRFRGADVATYLVAKAALLAHDPACVLDISANFRSQPTILEFVNESFDGVLDQANGQPGFVPLAPIRHAGSHPAVATYDITIEDHHKGSRGLSVELVRREEANILAGVVHNLIGAYPVWDKDLADFRPARAADIALVAPTGTSLWIYERAFEARGIPIASQAGKGFFKRQEVQDLIAVARTIADARDTLALGALLRGPLVGLTEEAIADEIAHLAAGSNRSQPLRLWTDPESVLSPILRKTLTVLQNLARKSARSTPYQLMAEAVEELQVRAHVRGRYRSGAERALANIDLVLEMARPYAARGMVEFSLAMRARWEEAENQAEGRPDAAADAVSIVTIHSAKGLEWPIVIPVNSMTMLSFRDQFLHRRHDDTVHFKVLGADNPDYEAVKQAETEELKRERIRLWYVALTRARDLLLLPLQSERADTDWFSLLGLDLASVPQFDASQFNGSPPAPPAASTNQQDLDVWRAEAKSIAELERNITWRQPSRHELPAAGSLSDFVVYASADDVTGQQPVLDIPDIRGSRERGLILHKLLEEVLTGETADNLQTVESRAAELIAQIGLADTTDPQAGLNSRELAQSALRGLALPEIAALLPRLLPEVPVYTSEIDGSTLELTAGIADAIAVNSDGTIDTVIDWKSDVEPDAATVAQYRGQVRDYLGATGAKTGLLVFLTTGRIETVQGADLA